MKKNVVLLMAFLPLLSFSQRLHLNVFAGFSNYQGDLQGKPFTLEQANGAYGAGLSYNVSNHISLRAGLVYGKIEASDKLNKASLQLRNLNFHSSVSEAHLLAEYNVFDLNDNKFSPYFFGGLAVYHFNPFTFDSLGNSIALQPLSTEGQGLAQYPGRKTYKLTQFSVPLGAGIKLRLSDNVVVSYEVGLRRLFTDHLDDVSSTYVDQATLEAAKGPKAVELAYRGDELKNSNAAYPPEGTLRGNARLNDWYYFHGITISIGIHTGRYGWKGKSGKYGCPVQVL